MKLHISNYTMNFINPYKLLGVEAVDNGEIKRAKRKILAQIELSDDGAIQYGKFRLNKSDFLSIIDQLDDPERSDHYIYLLSLPHLSAFLEEGDLNFFESYQNSPIYQKKSFVDFISPYFAKEFNEAFKYAFDQRDIFLIRSLVQNPPLVNQLHEARLYEGVYQSLQKLSDKLHQIRTNIDDESGEYEEENVDQVLDDIQSLVKVEVLNALPNYFQSIRNEIAQKIRNVSVAVFNNLNDAEEAMEIISFAIRLKISSLTKVNIEQDYEQIKEIYEERKESEKYTPQLAEYAGVLLQIGGLIKQFDSSEISSEEVKEEVSQLFVVRDLNALPEVFDEIREQIALGLRSLSVLIWNKEQDLSTAIYLVQMASSISVSREVKEQLNEAYTQLNQIRQNIFKPVIDSLKGINNTIRETSLSTNRVIDKPKLKTILDKIISRNVLTQIASAGGGIVTDFFAELKPLLLFLGGRYATGKLEILKNALDQKHPEWKNVKALYEQLKPKPVTASSVAKSTAEAGEGCLVGLGEGILNLILRLVFLFSILGVIGVASDTCSNSSSYSSSNPRNNSSSYPSSPPYSSTGSGSSQNYVSAPDPSSYSKYRGNQLKNGASPFDGCFGKGKYRETNSWILFKNGNSSDAIVCLVDIRDGRTVRNEYIRAGDTFKMTKLPNGTFYLKVFHGKDWNPNMVNLCGTKGGFDTNAHFSISDSPKDYISVNDDGYTYTTGEITLYTVANGNMNQRAINESAFFQ
ncbi:MAG: hypothetical protein H6605_11110 [Flavobacteriales bacterium]|nr:hypothetical protein [Flavobacteriales bacterium]